MCKTASMLLGIVIPAVLFGSTRMYEIEPYKNVNGWTSWQNNYVQQTFVSLVDSEFTYCDYFVGAANDTGHYSFEIRTYPGLSLVASGETTSGPSIHYTFVRAYLAPHIGAPPLIKGDSYILKISYSGSDSLNFYYNDSASGAAYPYGYMKVGNEDKWGWDLCARVQGVNKVVDSTFFGANSWYDVWTCPGRLWYDTLRSYLPGQDQGAQIPSQSRHCGRGIISSTTITDGNPLPHPTRTREKPRMNTDDANQGRNRSENGWRSEPRRALRNGRGNEPGSAL